MIATGNYSYDLINIGGSGSGVDGEDASVHLEDEYVPVGATEFNLFDASGFAAGDKVGDASTLQTQDTHVPTTAPTPPSPPSPTDRHCSHILDHRYASNGTQQRVGSISWAWIG